MPTESEGDQMSVDLTRMDERAMIMFSARVWLCIYTNLCLALRHPENEGPSRSMVEAACKVVGEVLLDMKVIEQSDLDELNGKEAIR